MRKYSFDDFIVDENNKYAYELAIAAATHATGLNECSAIHPNLLYIYGKSGNGKTHLLNAIENHIKENNTAARIINITAAGFLDEFIKALQDKKVRQFEEKYESVDALLIDDIWQWHQAERTQEEVKIILDKLNGRGATVIVTSDVAPSELTEIDDHLRTIFKYGYIAELGTLGIEAEIDLLNQLADAKNIKVDSALSDIFKYIAMYSKMSAAEVVAVFRNMITYHMMCDGPLSVDCVETIIKRIVKYDDEGEIES